MSTLSCPHCDGIDWLPVVKIFLDVGLDRPPRPLSLDVDDNPDPAAICFRCVNGCVDLVAAITAEVGSDEDELAMAVVAHLLKTHRLTYVRPSKLRRSVTYQSQRIRRHRDTTASTAPSGGIASCACRALPSSAWSSAGRLPSLANQRPRANA
jgi:hypothetical protein